ncbi:uncharacterized protein L969DRAFT_87364 [Mixia osmundae IAM 14324]|uniref:Telomere replication protein EST3 n=1 Tax=Mixia osmundae (strain CBS 9802 / IAM 14324 / JCM 22182 / KY 12970) TaxID=764103 RepID=G7E3L1_MIXOS|nr:uncharacterized protein L969DRAFT_87364 [Mixia osmundae IAM 14324]KEI39407.1 hypothetical protein L969DRAFT_87364 [Mixia osmundae IAM 14324]GAA97421.1 hypothetical protein E5Q_04099 [Mixia osmundae IAM 14324]
MQSVTDDGLSLRLLGYAERHKVDLTKAGEDSDRVALQLVQIAPKDDQYLLHLSDKTHWIDAQFDADVISEIQKLSDGATLPSLKGGIFRLTRWSPIWDKFPGPNTQLSLRVHSAEFLGGRGEGTYGTPLHILADPRIRQWTGQLAEEYDMQHPNFAPDSPSTQLSDLQRPAASMALQTTPSGLGLFDQVSNSTSSIPQTSPEMPLSTISIEARAPAATPPVFSPSSLDRIDGAPIQLPSSASESEDDVLLVAPNSKRTRTPPSSANASSKRQKIDELYDILTVSVPTSASKLPVDASKQIQRVNDAIERSKRSANQKQPDVVDLASSETSPVLERSEFGADLDGNALAEVDAALARELAQEQQNSASKLPVTITATASAALQHVTTREAAAVEATVSRKSSVQSSPLLARLEVMSDRRTRDELASPMTSDHSAQPDAALSDYSPRRSASKSILKQFRQKLKGKARESMSSRTSDLELEGRSTPRVDGEQRPLQLVEGFGGPTLAYEPPLLAIEPMRHQWTIGRLLDLWPRQN